MKAEKSRRHILAHCCGKVPSKPDEFLKIARPSSAVVEG